VVDQQRLFYRAPALQRYFYRAWPGGSGML
jgi:hypothetical protein